MRQQLVLRVRHLVSDFPTDIGLFDSTPRTTGALTYHQKTINRLNTLGLPVAVSDLRYLAPLRDTLTRWRAFRGSGPYPTTGQLSAGFMVALPRLNVLAGKSPDDPEIDWATAKSLAWEALGEILKGSGRQNVAAPIVGGSKVLHHVLPNLVPPMDRQETGWFMGWNSSAWAAKNATGSFNEAMDVFREVALAVKPRTVVNAGTWHTSVTKVLDNALAGAR